MEGYFPLVLFEKRGSAKEYISASVMVKAVQLQLNSLGAKVFINTFHINRKNHSELEEHLFSLMLFNRTYMFDVSFKSPSYIYSVNHAFY